MQIVSTLMQRYLVLYRERYKADWVPTGEHIRNTLDLIKPQFEGFPGLRQDDLLRRLDAFFRCHEDWLVATKHNYALYLKHIHRWLEQPAKVPVNGGTFTGTPSSVYCDCGNVLQQGEICQKCFPNCDNCGCQHAREERCEDFAARDAALRKMFNRPSSGRGGTKSIGEILK